MSDWTRPFPVRDGEDETQLKLRFADLWARFPWTNKVDLILPLLSGSDNMGRALLASDMWPKDLDVLEAYEQAKLTRGMVLDEMPTREHMIAEVVTVARTAISPDDKVKAYKLAAELCGYIEKKTSANINVGDDAGGDFLAALAAKLPN